MLSCTSSNKLTKGKCQRVPQNLDNPKNGRTSERGWALGHLPYAVQDQLQPVSLCGALPVRLCLMCQPRLHAVLWSHIATLVYFCTSPLQNFAVPQDFYSPLSISLEWSGWPRIWWCGIGGFKEQVRCLFVGLVALSPSLSPTIFHLSSFPL